MSASHRGLAVSDEAREKISLSKLGKRCSEGCTCGKHSRTNYPSRRCEPGCTCGRHSARFSTHDGATTHGMRGSPEYNSWSGMIQRCYNPSAEQYGYYGGRGITVCDRWRKFENFYADMGPRPEPKALYSIDRINNDGNYEPDNCRWATAVEQVANRRPYGTC